MQIAVQAGASCLLGEQCNVQGTLAGMAGTHRRTVHGGNPATLWPAPCEESKRMRTQNFSQTQRPEGDATQEAGRNPSRESAPSTRHAHWDELHGNGGTRNFLANVRQGIAQRPWTDIAIAAAAGFTAGWLMSSRQRSHAMHDLFIGSLLPAASKKVHHAYDALRDNGTLRDLGNQFTKLKSRW
jgi:hypothetical protein